MNQPRRPQDTKHRWLPPPSAKGAGHCSGARSQTHGEDQLTHRTLDGLPLDTRMPRRPRTPPPTAGEGSTNRTNNHADMGAKKTTINILVVKYDTVLITHRL